MNTVLPHIKQKTPKMKQYFVVIVTLVLFIAGCRKEIKLNIPKYEPKLVLEFYLEDNKSLSCLLQESIVFTDTTQFNLISNALVVLSYNGVKDTLFNRLYLDQQFEKIYNYHNPKIIKLQPNVDYEVYVKDNKGREMTGRTRLNNIIPIDTLIYNYNSENKAAAGLVFNDNGGTTNFYRIVAFKEAPVLKRENIWDINFDDILFNGDQFSFYTGYAFNPGDTVTGRLYHLTVEHNSFTRSVSNARGSSRNPFGQPANIISNVSGGIGVFTTLVYDEKKIILR
jgi:hypothetical protein